MSLSALLLIGQFAAGTPADLVAAAAATTRPRECRPFEMRPGVPGATVWRRARVPKLVRFCQLIARAEALLEQRAELALKVAGEAEALLPKRASTRVMVARAQLRRGDAKAALKQFEAALALDKRAADAPIALRDLALARLRGGKLSDALASYRRLAPVSGLLSNRAMRGEVLLEAAHVALAEGGEGRTDEALAYLREAGRDPHHPLRLAVTLSLVWVLDQRGHAAQADAVLSEHPASARYRGHGAEHLAQKADALALSALAAEAREPARARELWSRYLATKAVTPSARRAAEARLARLGRPKNKPKRRRRPR